VQVVKAGQETFMRQWLGLFASVTLLAAGPYADANESIYHRMDVVLDPQQGTLLVQDQIELPRWLRGHPIDLRLHAGLALSIANGHGERLQPEGLENVAVPVRRYRLSLPANQVSVTLRYSGRIAHPTEGGSGVRAGSPGTISAGGVYLGPESFWYPAVNDSAVRFALTVHVPGDWHTVSQGQREVDHTGTETWRADHPQQGIFLVANRFQRFHRSTPWGEASVYMYNPDPALAQQYLDATARYVDMYSRLIAPYPYAKFALVENIWETGYGMPSFTLLGPRVLRFPFIIHSSYPHEILHNWWGNGVYVDYDTGNWAEGLTTCLSDHLLAQQRGEGIDYRRSVLQKYADYVDANRDFPLTQFQGRHGEITQAVGYSKGMMLFHMLRREIGDKPFIEALRTFYNDNRFTRAGYEQLQSAFEASAGENLEGFFQQWVQRTGAPVLNVADVQTGRQGARYHVTGTLIQTEAGSPYSLRVPVVIQTADGAPVESTVIMNSKRQSFDIPVASAPQRLAVDPRFDLFRRLQPGELPASLGQLFGASRTLFVMPSAAGEPMRKAWGELAQRWGATKVIADDDLKTLPKDRTVCLLGWDNRHRAAVKDLLGARLQTFDGHALTIDGHDVSRGKQSAVLVARSPLTARAAVAWIGATTPDAVTALARKLPHYSKFSYLVFSGDDTRNVLKGRWAVVDSPMQVLLGDASAVPPLHLAPRPALTDAVRDKVR